MNGQVQVTGELIDESTVSYFVSIEGEEYILPKSKTMLEHGTDIECQFLIPEALCSDLGIPH